MYRQIYHKWILWRREHKDIVVLSIFQLQALSFCYDANKEEHFTTTKHETSVSIIFEDVWRRKPKKNLANHLPRKHIQKHKTTQKKQLQQPPSHSNPTGLFLELTHRNQPHEKSQLFRVFPGKVLGSRDDGIPFVVEGTGKDFITMTFQHLAVNVTRDLLKAKDTTANPGYLNLFDVYCVDEILTFLSEIIS